MIQGIIGRRNSAKARAALLVLVLGLVAGCSQHAAAAGRSDQRIANDIQAKIVGDQAIVGQNIQVNVADGVATLTGTVTDPASRMLADYDSGTIPGVKTVVNNLAVEPTQPAPTPALQTTKPAPAPVTPRWFAQETSPVRVDTNEERAQAAPPPTPAVSQATAQPEPSSPPPPPSPPKPVVKTVTLPAGTIIPVRITEELSSKSAEPNDVFHGSIAGNVEFLGVVTIPEGSFVIGRVVDARDAAHFKGSALLSLELREVTVRGEKKELVTENYTRQGEGRGKNTLEKTGGGAAFGSIIGAIAGGGKGAALGGLAGAAAGTGVNAVTRGQQVVIPSETLIEFRLETDMTFKVTIPPPGSAPANESTEPVLQRR
ncbi:MAG: BON domain-containing protein [Terracidiphilus sp.]|nr:BON domain-containing protein [Terracidiphilus sp.]